ncbi:MULTISPECIES: molybdopterin oxidoreductase family protein [Bacillus amyloliquefaciens group]|uniref:molybdopterin oxidoreductase family protein n=1 Tax=Bacillus amyloliquefaciens group TaxID=1938374 RepID=UPI000D6C081E|nr:MULTISPECIES: molybdopterin oxidoreductase family protein [Bacillus amyloliquefaciens group]AWM44373.1 oxidoreductase [Bacillus amyloliquefaciens]MDH3122522.1 molybdopterin oxidoreductase family protein [Bacillus velezensis]QHQ59055.1 molybdopterin-dependent oxidoreductase [Bacillus velezensis]RDY87162.1 oxidoreductase [Bacillus velezensis]
MNSAATQPNGVFKSVCSLDCPDQCGLLVTKKDGKIVNIQGDPDHPVTSGNICNKVRHMAERIYDEKRVTVPLKRIGKKGEAAFAPISWEEAINTISARWKELIAEEGAESILPYSFYGNMGKLAAEGMDRRFFHRLGASHLERTICSKAGSEGYNYTMGEGAGTDPEETIHAKLFIFWGINAVSTNMHQVMIAQKARKKGAKIVVIDVHKNQTGRLADWFIPIRPGTDAALALGIMHVLFDENLHDEAFLTEYTEGSDELKAHVKHYDPETVSAITGVKAGDIRRLARMYGETSPSLIRIGNGIQHHDNGGMIVRTVACLPAVTGQWLNTGGGAIKHNSAVLNYNRQALQRPDLLYGRKPRSFNMNRLGSVLLETKPPVRSLFIYGTNPAVVAPEANKVRKGLLREDLFTVVHDLFLTETAKYADIVLPAASAFENTDFYTSYWHHFIQLQKPVIEPYGDSKSNTEVFRLLAGAMGFTEQELQDSDEELIRQALDFPDNPYIEDIDYEALSRHSFMKAKRKKPLFPGKLKTPSGRIELYSEKMKQDGYPALPTHIPLESDDDFPLLFVPGPNHNFLNSTFSNNEKHVKLEKAPKLFIHTEDAVRRNIEDGETVRVWNHRGECELTASVGEQVLPGVAVSQGLWADMDDKKQLVNSLTPDRLADMGGGAVFFSGKVQVEKLSNQNRPQ